MQEIIKISELIDVDRDGFIDQYDIDAFLNRYGFIEEN